jgi:hypothetical protein
MKPSVKEVLRTLPKTQPALAPEVTAVAAMVQKLDEAITASIPAADTWRIYRRILGFYSHYGSFPGGQSAACSPRRESSLAGTPRTQAAVIVVPQQQQQQQQDAGPANSSSAS